MLRTAISLFLICVAVHAQITPEEQVLMRKKHSMAGGGKRILQTCSGSNAGGSVTTVPCTFGSAVKAHNTLFICFITYNNQTMTYSYSGETFTADSMNLVTFGSPSVYTASCNYSTNVTGGETTITITQTAGMVFPVAIGVEIAGVTSYDKSDAGASCNACTSYASNSVTPTNSTSMLVGVVLGDNTTYTAGTNVAWTLNATNFGSAVESFLQGATASVNAQMTGSSSGEEIAHIAVFH